MIPPEIYFKTMPKKWMGSGALFYNDKKEILIVKPTYKEYWEIPGGRVEENESPMAACVREIKEELGLDIKPGHLLCLDYISNSDEKGDRLMFVFDGGVLSSSDIGRIALQKEELGEYRFVSLQGAIKLLGERVGKRVPHAFEAISKNVCVYLEDGKPLK